MPKVSVLLSIYRPDERYLAEQLDSISAQSYSDYELVVYNDCPEDERQWEEFCSDHCPGKSLRYIQGEKNLGYAKAFERLVQFAKGQYIAFADQDDRWLPERLARGVSALETGYLLASCDRQTIDATGRLVEASWRAAHPGDASTHWKSGENITARAAFACYSIGMATMMQRDVAQALIPFPECTGHDLWLALGASALGDCANLDEALVQYRRHGSNLTGTLYGVSCKEDWYRTRTDANLELVREFARRFPDHPDADRMLAFCEARKRKDIAGIWRHRELAPQLSIFEIGLKLIPEWAFKSIVIPVLKR